MRFQSVGACATGTSHTEREQPCQDAFEIVDRVHGSVACVCDGAGSAAKSEIGARTLARQVAQQLSRNIEGLVSDPTAQAQVEDAIQIARNKLSSEGELADYHATLCGVVLTAHGTLVLHLGDGLIFGINPDDWSDYLVSEPENGAFVETTYFFTLPGWRQHLRVFCAPAQYRSWFLMSDGAASFAAKNSPWRPELNFLQPIHNYLRTTYQTQAEEALLGTLNDPRSHRITTDDKTLVWLHRAP